MSGYDPIRNTANPALQPGRSTADAPMQSRAVSYPTRPTLNPTPGAGGGVSGGGNLPGSVAPGGGLPGQGMGQPGAPMMPGAFAPMQGGLPGMNTANPMQAGYLSPEMINQGQPPDPAAGGAFGAPANLTQLGVTGLGPNSQSGMTFGGGASGFGRGIAGKGMLGAAGAGGFGRRS